MSALVAINDINVPFEVVGGEMPTVSSNYVAEVFEKNHADLLKAIRILPQDAFKSENFQESFYINKQNKRQPCYNLTRDGFSLLVMGFTGEKAYKWKIEFIKAFNMMEVELKRLSVINYVNQISDLNAVLIDKAKRHQREINGYKSQLVRHNKKITILKHELAKYEGKAKRYDDISYENLKALYHNTLLDKEFYKRVYEKQDLKEKAIQEALNVLNKDTTAHLENIKALQNFIYENNALRSV